MMPGDSPDPTMARKARLFASPLPRVHSDRVSRHHMHQHPAQAPRGPKSCSMSPQRSGVAGANVTGPEAFARERAAFVACLLAGVVAAFPADFLTDPPVPFLAGIRTFLAVIRPLPRTSSAHPAS